jgi:hypothetical protein
MTFSKHAKPIFLRKIIVSDDTNPWKEQELPIHGCSLSSYPTEKGKAFFSSCIYTYAI